jgi:hypothetical protein
MSARSRGTLGGHWNPREQECFYLRLLAETFAYELQREMQVRSEGGPWLPQEWVVALERERQEILDKIHHIEQVEQPSPPSVHPSADVLLTIPSTTAMARVLHTDIPLHNSPPSSQNSTSHSDSNSRSSFATSNIPLPAHRLQNEFFYHSAFHEIEGVLIAISLLGYA